MSSPQNSNIEEDYYKPYTHEVFEIEKILESRMNPRLNKLEYLIVWKRWPDENTWEPALNLQAQNQLLVEFEEHKKLQKQMVKSAQLSKKLKTEFESKVVTAAATPPLQPSSILSTEQKDISGRLRRKQQQAQQSQTKSRTSLNSFFEEDDDDNLQDDSDFDEEYVPYNADRNSEKNNISDAGKSITMIDEDDDEGEEQQESLDEELGRLKREFAMKYSFPKEMGFAKQESQDFMLSSSQELTQKTSVLHQSTDENKSKSQRRLAKRSKPSPSESELGGFLVDDISDISSTITYEYTINWKHQPNLDVQPEPQQISFTKVKSISPDQFISELSEHYVLNLNKQ